VRRLVLLVSVIVLVDTALYAALTPLLGRFAHELHLSSTGAGALVAAYAAGVLLGGPPGGIAAARLGPRLAVLAGLLLMGVASVGFAWAHSFPALVVARAFQGGGSALTWAGAFPWLIGTAPRERRGAVIGTAMGAAVVGALLGPVIGAVAALVGRGPVFSAVAALNGVFALIALTIPSHQPEKLSIAALGRAARDAHFGAGVGLLALAALLSAALSVISPLHLSARGWGPTAIGAVWLLASALEACESPWVGRLSDRHGGLRPSRWALAVGTGLTLALALILAPLPYALLVVLTSACYGILFTPAFTLIADGAERARLPQGIAFGMMNAAWAVGAMAGSAGAGALAQALGERILYLLAAAICLAAWALLTRRAPRQDVEAGRAAA
jgi:MFS family permease